ncbi:MAG TPA: TonB-dependent siderophore receptor, partial [Caldimonas sp.]|nr:TonB-dependent siderophore receptor [Caldimonas sp.]
EQLQDANVQRLSDLTRLAPGISDAYNSVGYIDYLTVRGYVLDNRFNYRRDGLPINAETSIPLDNKAAIEVLEGTSGMQAGTSAPGGLVNYVVKRPLEMPLRRATIDWQQPGSVLGAVDLSQRFGESGAVGARLNLAAEHLDPWLRDAKGSRSLAALALDARVSADALLEGEIEHSHRSQPSQPGFSALGPVVPAPGDPRINLNDQPWSLPVVFDATTASLRWQQRLNADWRFTAHAMTQHLKTDDRVAFPFGCTAESNFDRYCSDGTFDLYDYRSENERRTTDALDAHVDGRFATGGIRHALTTGVLGWRTRLQFQTQTFNLAGVGTVDGNTIVPPAPDALSPPTNRDEHTTELYARDAIAFNARDTLWLGLRHSRLHRTSIGTDGSAPTDASQSFTTPWIAASHAFDAGPIVYASWGEGVESEVTPNLPFYSNAGQSLPSLKSRQTEIGVKREAAHAAWSIAAFDIVRPLFGDIGTCDPNVNGSCTHELDGTQQHRGVEASGRLIAGAWTLDGGALWLHARREGGHDPALDGKRPPNVPSYTAKLGAEWRLDEVAAPGLALRAGVVHEGPREVLPDNSLGIPSWTRVDLGARLVRQAGGRTWTVRAGVDNAFGRRAWRESPYQFQHVYLFPLAPRTAWVSVQADL